MNREKLSQELAVGDKLVAPCAGTVVSVTHSKTQMISSPDTGAAFGYEISLDGGKTMLSHPMAVHIIEPQ